MALYWGKRKQIITEIMITKIENFVAYLEKDNTLISLCSGISNPKETAPIPRPLLYFFNQLYTTFAIQQTRIPQLPTAIRAHEAFERSVLRRSHRYEGHTPDAHRAKRMMIFDIVLVCFLG